MIAVSERPAESEALHVDDEADGIDEEGAREENDESLPRIVLVPADHPRGQSLDEGIGAEEPQHRTDRGGDRLGECRIETDSPRRCADSHPTLAAKPPTTKNSGVISAIQVAGANHRCPLTGLTMNGEPSELRPTPTRTRWTKTTMSTQTTRARSRVRSRVRGIVGCTPAMLFRPR